jgi:AAA ATPase domain
MWLKTVAIRNFRSIENLSMSFDRRANVIVGPNAIGKTTLLEAIRLAKAALAPRTINETQQAFMGLGAVSPHNPLAPLNYAALARDSSRPVEIDAEFGLTGSEIQGLDSLAVEIATAIVRAGLGAPATTQGPLALVQYLSSSAGSQRLDAANKAIATEYRP